MLTHSILCPQWALLPLFALAAPLAAQGLTPLHPFSQTRDFYVGDSGDDAIYRFSDLNLDGDYNDQFEVTRFYDENLGPYTLGNNNGITVGGNGIVYIADSSEDKVFALWDSDQDGECNDGGEIWEFFVGDPADPNYNQSGIDMVSSGNMDIDAQGRVYVAVSNTSIGDNIILVLEDKNFDLDANDFGEALVFYHIAPLGASADSIPQDVVVGPDGHLYYVDIGTTGVIAKGVHRLDDADSSGTIDQPGEAAPYFIPPTLPKTPFFWALSFDAAGNFYLADTGNDVLWKFNDANANNVIDPGEETLYWTSPVSSLLWKCVPGSDGSLLCAESQTPDRVLSMVDANSDNVIDPATEVAEVYNEDLAFFYAIGNPRTIAWARQPTYSAASVASIGTPVQFITQATQGDAVVAFYAGASVAPMPLVPYGLLELDPLPPNWGGLFYIGAVATNGFHVFAATVPSNPNLVGKTMYAQSVVGTAARAQFSNMVSQTYQ